ncbi:MAG: class I SAM-dependent methyltransferase [Actinomycetaceae bacterium]|nr:class I SAM-dependent methyltransferase [Actinomycetaceae bacterium]
MAQVNPWDTAAPANAFERAGGEYQDFRPSYPEASVAAALLGKTAPAVVDVGAGTGKFTEQLLQAGATAWAVEPASAMREQLLAAPWAGNPLLHVVDGTAENTGLPSQIADVITYAQSWHWVDPEAALTEAARLLRPGGIVSIIFNQMDVSISWVHRLTRIMRSGDIHTPQKPPALAAGWEAPSLHKTEFTSRLTPEGIKALARTRSSYLKSTAANREKMQANLQWYLLEHLGYSDTDLVEIPYYTLVWTTKPST